jgi:hypothetical protein
MGNIFSPAAISLENEKVKRFMSKIISYRRPDGYNFNKHFLTGDDPFYGNRSYELLTDKINDKIKTKFLYNNLPLNEVEATFYDLTIFESHNTLTNSVVKKIGINKYVIARYGALLNLLFISDLLRNSAIFKFENKLPLTRDELQELKREFNKTDEELSIYTREDDLYYTQIGLLVKRMEEDERCAILYMGSNKSSFLYKIILGYWISKE